MGPKETGFQDSTVPFNNKAAFLETLLCLFLLEEQSLENLFKFLSVPFYTQQSQGKGCAESLRSGPSLKAHSPFPLSARVSKLR